MKFTLSEPLHVTADWKRAVKPDDPLGAFVLGGRGSEIDYDLAVELNLVGCVGDTVTESEQPNEPVSLPLSEPSAEQSIPNVEEVDATAGAKKLASEHNIDLHTLQGSIDGRITKRDVQDYIANELG